MSHFNRPKVLAGMLCLGTFTQSVVARKFYPDDPLWVEPKTRSVKEVQPSHLDNFIDFAKNSFYRKGERNSLHKVYPSQGVNTLGEVPNNDWYTNRHWLHPMSEKELAIGPNKTGAPDPDGPWTVTSAKAEGVTPGFTIKDQRGRRYLLKFDPPSNPEMATAADVMGAKFFYALGYNVPENYIVRFDRSQLKINPGVKFTVSADKQRDLTETDLDGLLAPLHRQQDGRIRAMASLYISGKPLGGFKYYGWRADDPNEIAPHEHLRVLRGLQVFCAWLNHTDSKSLNSLDVLTEDNARSFVKHYLLDFGAAFGSDSLYAKDPRLGHEYFLDWDSGLRKLYTFGFIIPAYARAKYPDDPAVGNFSAQSFNPEKWKSNYPNAAFTNRLVGDEFWAAKQVMAFSPKDIETIVRTGEFTESRSETAIAQILTKRADIIAQTLLPKLLALDNFRVEDNELRYADLGNRLDLRKPVSYKVEWSAYDERDDSRGPIVLSNGSRLPAEALGAPDGAYWAARIQDQERRKAASVYFRKQNAGWSLVGIERDGADGWEAR